MAATYGRITGGRGSVTRTGTHGMTATVQTWDGALTLQLDRNGAFTLTRHEASNGGHHSYVGEVIAQGSVKAPAEVTP